MYRAIVVDDEPFMLEGMRLMIDWAACGFELVGEAGTAQDALRLVDRLHPDLVITDIRMPGLLGTDLAELISRYHPETIVLFISGYRDFSYAKAGIAAHVFDYLLKPIDPDEVQSVLARVKEALEERRAQQNEGVVPVLRDHVLRRVAYGDDSTEALVQCGLLLGIAADEAVCCAVTELCAPGESPGTRVEDVWHISGATHFSLSPKLLCVLFRGDANLSALAGRRKELSLVYGIESRVGIGRMGRGVEGFRDSLRQALDALGAWFVKEGALRRYRDFDRQAAQFMIDAEAAALEDSLRKKQRDAFEAQLRHLERVVASEKPDLFCLRAFSHTIGVCVAEEAGADGPQVKAIYELSRDDKLTGEAWMRAFSQALRAHAARVFSGTPAREQVFPEAVTQVLRYVEEAYASDASIGDIAARLYMNPAYLGQLVRRHTGETFHMHLLRARMSQACRMLRQTDMPVSAVAHAVGIRDVDYFTAQFKRHTSMNPNAFRTAASREGKPS